MRTGYTAVMEADRRAELKAFLRKARSRLTPEAVGLPATGRRRRTAGLRIEETAAVAGVSLTWYQALEGGKGVGVSAAVLSRLGDALRLNSEEREMLAALSKPMREPLEPSAVDPLMQSVVDGFVAGPAFISDRFWNVLAFNEIADVVYGFAVANESNLLIRMFDDSGLRRLHDDWERIAHQMVAILHLSVGHTPEDERGHELVATLRARSDQFAKWWDGFELRRFLPTRSVLHHERLGTLTLTFMSFVSAAVRPTDDPVVLVLQPAADEATRRALLSVIP